jgi:chromosome segregation ATPase
LKGEREGLEAKLREHTTTVDDWSKKHGTLQDKNAAIQKQLDAITAERDALAQDKAALQTEAGAGQKSVEDMQKRLSQASSELSTNARQLQTSQAELRAALRRAEEAERMQRDLQAEGTQLLRSLDEMRPKVVELSNEKADLMEKSDRLDIAVKGRDAVIAQLETSLAEAQQQRDETEKRRRSAEAAHAKEHSSSQETLSELQKAYAELQTDAEQAYSMVRDFEMQRRSDQQTIAQYAEDVDRLTKTASEFEKQLVTLQAELAERGQASDEQQDFLGRTQTEIEFLRGEVAIRDEEIQKLQQQQDNNASAANGKSWDDEMMNATKQQLDLELSSAQSRIRELEAAVFEAEDKAHGLQKQVNSLQDQLAHSILVHARSASQEGRRAFSPTYSPTGPSRPSSRLNHSDSRRPSLTAAHRSSHSLAPPPRSALDYNMSPETRHKRQVSLNMLKARMDSEAAAAAASRPSSRAISPMPPGKPGSGLGAVTEADNEQHHSFRRPQFTNESFFWCSSCNGDLLIL